MSSKNVNVKPCPLIPHVKSFSLRLWRLKITKQIYVLGYCRQVVAQCGHLFKSRPAIYGNINPNYYVKQTHQLNVSRRVDVVRTTCQSSNWTSEWGRKKIEVILYFDWDELLVWSFHKLLIYGDSHGIRNVSWLDRERSRNGPVSCSCAEEKYLVDVRAQRSEWARWT